jgi:hypothetical protein
MQGRPGVGTCKASDALLAYALYVSRYIMMHEKKSPKWALSPQTKTENSQWDHPGLHFIPSPHDDILMYVTIIL